MYILLLIHSNVTFCVCVCVCVLGAPGATVMARRTARHATPRDNSNATSNSPSNGQPHLLINYVTLYLRVAAVGCNAVFIFNR